MILIDGKKPKICIDPGHGGEDSGAIGPNGTRESDVVLSIGKELMYQLDQMGISNTFLTREDDSYISLAKRTEMAENSTCMISIHCNSVSMPRVNGIEVLYPKPGKESKALANYLNQSLHKYAEGHRDRGIKMSPSKGYPKNLYVLRMAPCPVSLAECEFISNKEQEEWLASENGQKQIALGLAEGIKSFLYSLPGGSCAEKESEENEKLKDFIDKGYDESESEEEEEDFFNYDDEDQSE